MKLTECSIVGMMSGTSLDGLDIACCRFSMKDKQLLQYEILRAETVPYPDFWEQRLRALDADTPALELAMAHVELGHWMGRQLHDFVKRNRLHSDAAASHGHTVFHQPENGMTLQIGDPAAIAVESGLPCIADFRSGDVALGGQGAPLVPIGDIRLFGEYDACLNIGGISNISFRSKVGEKRLMAFDVAPANMVLNFLARREGQPYDRDGEMAASGKVLPELLEKLESLPYYRQPAPKSLGKEWVEQCFLPLLPLEKATTADLLETVTLHIARQIASVCNENGLSSVLLSGGGAKNGHLRACLQQCAPQSCFVLPSEEVVDYKEALVFAFLGLLRLTESDNCLQSVTGASRNHCGGAIYLP